MRHLSLRPGCCRVLGEDVSRERLPEEEEVHRGVGVERDVRPEAATELAGVVDDLAQDGPSLGLVLGELLADPDVEARQVLPGERRAA